MINLIYISIFFLSGIILYLIKNDLKKFKPKLYYEIDNEIWIKLYSFIVIVAIHLSWLFSVLIINYKDENPIYGFNFFLIFAYIIYLYPNFQKNNLSIASTKLDKYMNSLMTLYFIVVIIAILIPNRKKEKLIQCIKSLFNKF